MEFITREINKILGVIHLCIIILLLTGCSNKKNADKSNENLKTTRSALKQSDEALHVTNQALALLEKELEDLEKKLMLTQGVVKELAPVFIKLVKNSRDISDSISNKKNLIYKQHANFSILVENLNPIVRFAQIANKYGEDPNTRAFFKQILDKYDGVKSLLKEGNQILYKINNCTITVFRHDFYNPTMMEVPEEISEIMDESLESYRSDLTGKNYYIIPEKIRTQVKATDKELVTIAGCDDIEKNINILADRTLQDIIEMMDEGILHKSSIEPTIEAEETITVKKKEECAFNYDFWEKYICNDEDDDNLEWYPPHIAKRFKIDHLMLTEEQISIRRTKMDEELNDFHSRWKAFMAKWEATIIEGNRYSMTKEIRESLTPPKLRYEVTRDFKKDRRKEIHENLLQLANYGSIFIDPEDGIDEFMKDLEKRLGPKVKFVSPINYKFGSASLKNKDVVRDIVRVLYYYSDDNDDESVNQLRYLLADTFFYTFDEQFSKFIHNESRKKGLDPNDQVASDIDLSNPYVQNKLKHSHFKNKKLKELEEYFVLTYLEQIFDFITDAYSRKTLNMKVDLYDFPYGDLKINQDLKILLDDFDSSNPFSSAVDLDDISIKELKYFENTIQIGGADRIISLWNEEIDNLKSITAEIAKVPRTSLSFFKDLYQTQSTEELLHLLTLQRNTKNTEILLNELIKKGLNRIRNVYIKEQSSGKKVNLRVLTLNTFLLYIEPMASNDVYSRAEKIAHKISQLSPAPDIILLQEVFPNDINKLDSESFLWPNSNDWPLRDVQTILNVLNDNSNKQYHLPITGHKQIGLRYRTIKESVYQRYLGEDVDKVFADPYYNPLNMGPPGTVILASKKLKGTDINTFFDDEIEVNLKHKGDYFSRFDRGNILNSSVPISRGILSGLFEIEGFGVFNASTTHLTTAQQNNLQRVFQTSQILNEKSLIQNSPLLYVKETFAKFLFSISKMHIDQDIKYENIHHLGIEGLFDYFRSIKKTLIKKSLLTQVEFSNIENYFKTLSKQSFSNNYLFNIIGGDFNFEPFGSDNLGVEQRDLDKWGMRLFNDCLDCFSAIHSGSSFPGLATYDPFNNHYARDNSTDFSELIMDMIDEFLDNLNGKVKETANKLMEKFGYNIVKKLIPNEKQAKRKLDYLFLTDGSYSTDSLVSIKESEYVLKDYNQQVSDHYGVMMDITIFKNDED